MGSSPFPLILLVWAGSVGLNETLWLVPRSRSGKIMLVIHCAKTPTAKVPSGSVSAANVLRSLY